LVERATDHLQAFGVRADPLRAAAMFVLERKS
jgi:hypothetical protein